MITLHLNDIQLKWYDYVGVYRDLGYCGFVIQLSSFSLLYLTFDYFRIPPKNNTKNDRLTTTGIKFSSMCVMPTSMQYKEMEKIDFISSEIIT